MKDLPNSPTDIMSSSADIVAAIRSLDLGRSLDPSNLKTESIKAKTKTTDSQPKPKPKPQPAKTNPINIPKQRSESQSSRFQPPKSQPERPTVYPIYTPLGPPPNIINKTDKGKIYQFQARAEPGNIPASSKKIRRSPRNYTKRSNSTPILTQAVSSIAPLLS
ncbi:hypothetical protein BGZ60DRAFT_540161 [Tricladium varicosporioides]|nr:hypothetical protein BGZ60DRAFT_540161 [Hymenoscyphus varicosporioides]